MSLSRPGVLAVFVFLAAVLVMSPAIRTPFLWDDRSAITENPGLRRLANVPRFLLPAYWQRGQGVERGVYRPLRETAFCLMRAALGFDAAAWHGINIGLHGMCAVFVFLIGRRCVGGGAAVAAGLLFAVHPAHVEAVAFAKNLGELLATALALASALTWLSHAGSGNRGASLAASALLFGLSLLAKETAIALPAVLAALTPAAWQRERRRLAWSRTVPQWLLAALYVALQAMAVSGGAGQKVALGAGGRLGLIGWTVVEYARMAAVPVGLCAWRAPDFTAMSDMAVAYVAAAAIIVAAALAVYARRPGTGVGLVWFLVALAPAANVAVNPDRPLAEQRLYFPTAGFFLSMGALLLPRIAGGLSGRAVLRRRAACLAAALIVAWAAQAVDRGRVWRSSASLWSDTVRRAPARCEAHFNLAQAWLTESASASPDPGRLRAAEARCVWALRNKPGDARARVTLASLALAAGDPATAKALLFEGLKRDMNQAELWNALGFVYLAASEGEQGKAEASLRWAIELDGSLAAAHGNLGRALAVRGDWQGAVRCLEKAIEVGADRAAWRVALAEACLRLSAEEPALRGRALEHARQAARLEPGNPEVRRLLDRLEGPASPRR